MSKEQQLAIRCACADLIGSIQAYKQSDPFVHDWKAHLLSIEELMDSFPFLYDEFGQALNKLNN